MPVTSPLHLMRRFVGVVRARSLGPDEQQWVAAALEVEGHRVPGADLFWSQAPADQRHAHDVARWVAVRAEGRPDLVVAALLHDVGKRHIRMGAVQRSVATVWPLRVAPPRVRAYRTHGALGARDLDDAGAPTPVTQFARHHQGGRPPGFDPADWEMLTAADHRA